MSIVLIDGTYQMCRAVYAPGGDLVTSTGLPTGGIYLFLKMLWNFKDLGTPVCIFDSPGARSKFRREIYPAYKLREEPKDDAERMQKEESSKITNYTFNSLRSLLPKMGIPFISVKDQEGDDVVYRMAEHYSKQGEDVWVVSDDKDYLQFLNLPKVRVYQPMKDLHWDVDKFRLEYKFDVPYFTLYKSLMGDGSDNIAGIKGIGEKTAQKICMELPTPTIAALLEWAKSGDKGVHKKVEEGLKDVKRNMNLMDLTRMDLTFEEVMLAFQMATKLVSCEPQFVLEQFKKYEFHTFGNWITYVMHRSQIRRNP